MDKKSDHHTIKQFVAGGIAGGIAKTLVAPFDRINILLQGHHKYYKHLGPYQAFHKILRYDGFQGLYKGHGASLVRIIPYAAVQFATYEYLKELLELKYGHHIYTKFAAGACAGMVAVAFTYPLDSLRTVIAFQPTGPSAYTGTVQALNVIITKHGGARMLFKGFSPTLVGMIPYAGISFCGFETFKRIALEHGGHEFGRPCPKNDGQLILKWYGKLLCGATAATIATTMAYPFGVIRRKMQLYPVVVPNSRNFKTMFATAKYVFKKRGARGFYRGLCVANLKVAPMVAVSFCMYEMLKELFGLEDAHEAS